MENGDFSDEYEFGENEEEGDLVYSFWEWVETLKKKNVEGIYSSIEEDGNEGEGGFSPINGTVQEFSTDVFLQFKSELDNIDILEKINEQFFEFGTSPANQIGQFTLVSADVIKVSELIEEDINILYGIDEEAD